MSGSTTISSCSAATRCSALRLWRAGEAFGIDLTLRDLFQAPTIRQLAARIEEIVFAMIEAMDDDEAQARAGE